MTFLAALGEFPEMVLGLALSLGCALLLGFLCLQFLLMLMTGRQYSAVPEHNVVDDPGHSRALLLLGAAVAGSGSADAELAGGRAGGPYLVPAGAPNLGFLRAAEPDGVASSRVVELPIAVAGRVAPAWSGDGNDAA
jgi:hypothetical protein